MIQEPTVSEKFHPFSYTSTASAYTAMVIGIMEAGYYGDLIGLTPVEVSAVYKKHGYSIGRGESGEYGAFMSFYNGDYTATKAEQKPLSRAFLYALLPVIYFEDKDFKGVVV